MGYIEQFPVEIGAESVELDIAESSGELIATIRRENGDNLTVCERMPDGMIDQLLDEGDIDG